MNTVGYLFFSIFPGQFLKKLYWKCTFKTQCHWKITQQYPLYVVLYKSIEMMSKCSNPGSQTTCMQLVWNKMASFHGLFNKMIDSMLPCACSEIYPRWCQNVLKTKKWHMSHRHTFTGLFFFFGVSDVFTKFWWLLWSTEQTHGNMESICFIQWTERKKKTNLPCTTWLFNDLCQFNHFSSNIGYFSFFCHFFSSLSYLCSVSPKSFSMPEGVGGITCL